MASAVTTGRAVLAATALLALPAGLAHGGTKARVDRGDNGAALNVEEALTDMALAREERNVQEEWGRALASTERGDRSRAHFTRADGGGCEGELSDANRDESDMEERFLRLLQAR